VGAVAQLPQPGVGLVEFFRRAFAQGFQLVEQRRVAAPRQALVEEDVGGGQHRRAIDVVLDLLIGLVADAHRAHAAVAGQPVGDSFVEPGPAVDAEHRLQGPAPASAATLTM
jgi:hypothetical protein